MNESRKPEVHMSRRSLLKGAAGGLVGTTLADTLRGLAPQQESAALRLPANLKWETVESSPADVTRTWLGRNFWANRLQDWRLHEGRFECLAGESGSDVRTIAILTREIVAGAKPGYLQVRAGLVENHGGGGFCGFLVGAGAGKLDYRAAALVQKASGVGGGILCTYETDGKVRFREHTSEEAPLAFSELPSEAVSGGNSTSGVAQEVLLRLVITPTEKNKFDLVLSAWDPATGRLLTGARRRNVGEAEILGGIALVSSPARRVAGARFWFRHLLTAGEKIARHPERALGPILGTLYSVNGESLKLSAQLAPVGESEPQQLKVQYRAPGGAWRDGPVATLEPGFTAQFQVKNWDATRAWEYRVVYPIDVSNPATYTGTIQKDPGKTRALKIGLLSCTIAAARSLEGGVGAPELPQGELLGRYTEKNFYFPHRRLVENLSRHSPDLLVFAGDQLYEGNPTRRDGGIAPTLDYLYKWYLWVWSFRELTRNTPTVIQVDDHDVYHGNLWGNGGRLAPERDQNRGGYRCRGDFVNIVQRTQCGHNPEPYDPTRVDQDISVYYCAFRYGGVSFALIEDRKFKTSPMQGGDLDVHEAELLGERQENFLQAWAKDWDDVSAKVCLTQSLFGCVQTSPAGKPLTDFDANGYPMLGRDRAVELLRQARALVLAGDQHLGTLVRHGLETYNDAVVQFTGPAAGSSWQRWFEPRNPLPNPSATPNTGDFTDAYGNKVRVLAVANPKLSFAEYRKQRKGRGQGLGDRRLKSEGYGIIRVEHEAKRFVIECWPWTVDPNAADARQFPGWPYILPFDKCAGETKG